MKSRLILLSTLFLAVGCSQKAPIDYVDPFIGTGFHGHTYPGATTPHGAVQLSPDTRRGNWDASSGYHYSDNVIYGFSHTHLSGTGCIDLGDILFHPTTKEPVLVPEGYIFEPLAFSHKDEKASPGYYSVEFKDEGIKAELTATKHTGVHRYTYKKGSERSVIIDMSHLLDNETMDMMALYQISPNGISGMRRTQGWTPDQYVYFVAAFSEPFTSVDFICDGKVIDDSDDESLSMNRQAVLNFGKSDGTPLVAKVGLSMINERFAGRNLYNDIPSDCFDFDEIHKAARTLWEEALSDIVVEGGSKRDLTNFYTAQYHAKIVPNMISEDGGYYRGLDGNTTLAEEGNRYSTLSLWDTFRAWHPLITLTDTELADDIIKSMLDMYRANPRKELPIWPLASGETGTMIGYHAASVIADAYLKGIDDYSIDGAYEAMVRSSNINKKGSDYYTEYGFIPSNIKKESVSCALEYAYDDWCIAMMAKALGRDKDYDEYSRRALNYTNVFDGNTMFFRGKRLDGNWETPFNEFAPDRAFTEATPWQYRFFAPHDVNGLIQLFGGADLFTEALDELFVAESKIEGDMQDITGMIGQYAHGNEPSHHMAYMYNYVGQPWKTQAMTRRILDEMYDNTPEGIIGNEDCGQMSAWYILSSLGMYSVCPGTNEFNLTTPLFKKAAVKLANGNTLLITANDPAKNVYIDKVELNGKEITENYITYDQIMEGGELKFTLSPKPNTTRGTSPESFPYSFTEGGVVSIPYTSQDLHLFENEVEVDLATRTEGAEIYYTLDGSEPTIKSKRYTAPFTLSSSRTVKAKAFKAGYAPSATFSIAATRATFKHAVKAQGVQNGVNYSYYEGWMASAMDIEKTRFVEKGVLPEPSIAGAKQEDHFSFIYTGYINVPESGIYDFATRSDDGSVLFIDGEKVVDNDGSHAAIIATGRVGLQAGFHRFELRYFEDYEGNSLEWGWKRPSADSYEFIPANALYIK